MASNVLQAVCYFHQYYNLCDRKCKHKKTKCPLMNATAAATVTATQEPSSYYAGEDRRRSRRDRTKRQWMMPPALAGLRM